MCEVTCSFLQDGCTSLSGLGLEGGKTVVFLLSQTAQENAVLKVLANLKMDLTFSH